jgi:hypothetical protein
MTDNTKGKIKKRTKVTYKILHRKNKVWAAQIPLKTVMNYGMASFPDPLIAAVVVLFF